jgi:hypothetical protein
MRWHCIVEELPSALAASRRAFISQNAIRSIAIRNRFSKRDEIVTATALAAAYASRHISFYSPSHDLDTARLVVHEVISVRQ